MSIWPHESDIVQAMDKPKAISVAIAVGVIMAILSPFIIFALH